jgi:predicted XRE-type DNA-binding protein
MASRNVERREPVTRGTGNVFADLGFPDAAERQEKLRLAYALNQVLDERKLSQADAAKVLGVTQPTCLRFVTTSWRAFPSNA